MEITLQLVNCLCLAFVCLFPGDNGAGTRIGIGRDINVQVQVDVGLLLALVSGGHQCQVRVRLDGLRLLCWRLAGEQNIDYT